jgi:squalene-hopene/tetraprenyl-beta-curcumene cyclase
MPPKNASSSPASPGWNGLLADKSGRMRVRGDSDDPRLDDAIAATRDWLLDRQVADGHWVGELEGDSLLESEYILLLTFLGRDQELICGKAAAYIRLQQLVDGGWSIYPGGPAEISSSVKAYFALKLTGLGADEPLMVRARRRIHELGGAQACNSFTRFYLALLGQMTYDECPSVPPELALLPHNYGLGAMSAWTRTIVVPLAIMSACKPVRNLPPGRGIAELFRLDMPRRVSHRTKRLVSWENFFLAGDRFLKLCDRFLPSLVRRPGLRASERWMERHLDHSDGLGAIFPPMIYTIVAFECLGVGRDEPKYKLAVKQLEDLLIEEDDGTARLQPCVSPVWDTAIAVIAQADASLGDDHPSLIRAANWLLDREIRIEGDWHKRRPGPEPTGWNFQYRNGWYPDIDDTAMVLLALLRTSIADEAAVRDATRRGVAWLLAMQNKDGGWAAFDVDIDFEVLTKVPFADHNAMLDPSCADITMRIVELLGVLGHRADHPAIARALAYTWKTQEPEGCWYGRWGVNYIYGTWQVLQGLKAIDFDMTRPPVARAVAWLEQAQQDDGGWGETCETYDDRSLMGRGETTASQTAWAVLGLVSAGRAGTEAVSRGIEYLVNRRNADGSWDESQFTGTGFPKVFYMKYHYYRISFPLMALSRYRSAIGPAEILDLEPAATGGPR